jgi:hypothetical protein
MSLVPMGGIGDRPNPTLIDRYPDVYLDRAGRREPREGVRDLARRAGRSARSHQRAIAAIDGRFAEEIVPVTANLIEGSPTRTLHGRRGGRGHTRTRQVIFAVDEGHAATRRSKRSRNAACVHAAGA